MTGRVWPTTFAMLLGMALGAGAAHAAELMGTVQSWDRDTQTLTLADGTRLGIGRSVEADRSELRPGANVRVIYEERGSQKAVTSIVVLPPGSVRPR